MPLMQQFFLLLSSMFLSKSMWTVIQRIWWLYFVTMVWLHCEMVYNWLKNYLIAYTMQRRDKYYCILPPFAKKCKNTVASTLLAFHFVYHCWPMHGKISLSSMLKLVNNYLIICRRFVWSVFFFVEPLPWCVQQLICLSVVCLSYLFQSKIDLCLMSILSASGVAGVLTIHI